MNPADFGEVQALISLYMQGAIFLNILSFVTIHVTVNIEDEMRRNQTLLALERVAIIVGGSMLAIALLFVQKLKEFLNFHEVWPFLALIAALGLTIPLVFRMAFLRGRKLFAKSALTDGMGSLTKLILAPILVVLGFKAFGAIAALAISQIFSLGLAYVWARQAGFQGFGLKDKQASLTSLKPQLAYTLSVFLVSLSIFTILSLDILAVKHYFPPEIAGFYAGIATIARIIYFLTAPITGVLLTAVSLNQSKLKNRYQLLGSLGLITGIGGTALLFISALPELSIKILVGSKYLAFANYLPRLSLVMLLLAIANAMLMYNISLRRYKFSWVPLAALILTIILVTNNHASVSEIINSLLIGSSALIIGTTILNILPANNHRRGRGPIG